MGSVHLTGGDVSELSGLHRHPVALHDVDEDDEFSLGSLNCSGFPVQSRKPV